MFKKRTIRNVRFIIVLVILIFLQACNLDDKTTSTTLDLEDRTDNMIDPKAFLNELIEKHDMPNIEVGQHMKLMSDTKLLATPDFSAQVIEYLQGVELEIIDVQGFFVNIRTLSFNENIEGWISLWALHPESTNVKFFHDDSYFRDQMKIAVQGASIKPLPLEVEAELSNLYLEQNQTVRARRMIGEYYEIEMFGRDSKHYSQVWIKKTDVIRFDPELVVQGSIPNGTNVELEEGGELTITKPEIVWIIKRNNNNLEVRLSNGDIGKINTHDFIKNPFYSLPGYNNTDHEVLLWSENFTPEDEASPFAFHINANRGLDKKSVEQAIAQSFEKDAALINDKSLIGQRIGSMKPASYELKWVSDRDFYMYISGMQYSDTYRFHLEDAYTADRMRLGEKVEKMRLYFTATFLPEQQTVIHLSSATNMNTTSLSLPSFQDYRMIERVDGSRRLLLYGRNNEYVQIDPDSLEQYVMPTLTSFISSSRMGDNPEMAADYWDEKSVYVVLKSKELYLYDLDENTGSLIYSSEKPIYGLAVSPDRQHVALLVSKEKYSESSADLVVFNKRGKVIFEKENASLLFHSDGVYSIYPIGWFDNHNIVVDTFYTSDGSRNAAFGVGNINIQTGKISYLANPLAVLYESGTALQLLLEGIEIELSHPNSDTISSYDSDQGIYYQWSPDQTFIVFKTNNQLYVYETMSKKLDWIGMGHFVEWTGADTFIWMQGYSPYFNF